MQFIHLNTSSQLLELHPATITSPFAPSNNQEVPNIALGPLSPQADHLIISLGLQVTQA